MGIGPNGVWRLKPYVSSALEGSAVIKASRGVLKKLEVIVDKAIADGSVYVQVWDGDPAASGDDKGELRWSEHKVHTTSTATEDSSVKIEFLEAGIKCDKDVRIIVATDPLDHTTEIANAATISAMYL